MMWKRRSTRGVVLIWVVLLFLVLVGFVGLALDTALIVLTGQQLQIGADAASLAGAAVVRGDQVLARNQALNLGQQNTAAGDAIQLDRNDANVDSGDVVIGRFNRTTQFFDVHPATIPNAVKVVARRGNDAAHPALPLLFGPIFGVNTASLERTAIAMVGGGTGSGIITLDLDEPKSFYVPGNATVRINDAGIQVNSNQNNAALFQGSFTVDAKNLNVVGDIATTGNSGDLSIPTSAITTGVDPIEDPLRFLAEPNPTGMPLGNPGTVSLSTGELHLSPGYYSGGITASGGTIYLAPGIYCLGGPGLNLQGNVNMYGDGVMFYIDQGAVNINGTGDVKLTPPDPDIYAYSGVDTYEGVLIFQARDNTASSKINGTSGLDLTGTLYFPHSTVELGGTSDKIGTQFIAANLTIFGNANLTINYDGDKVAPGNHVFLVL